MKIVVSKEKNGDCETIGEALEKARKYRKTGASDRIIIYIGKGVYQEKLVVDCQNISMIGENVQETIITYGDYAKKHMPDGMEYGTFRTATLRIDADYFLAENITFINASGNGKEYGQAIALYVEGDCVSFHDCRMIGCQDTLFTAPLPPKKKTGGNGHGPKAEGDRRNGRQYYDNCYIRGDIDFIFGGATAYFEGCEIFSNYGVIEDEARLPEKGPDDRICGYVTAACTKQGQEYGYVFHNCRFTSDCPANTVYLGRPWRDFAKTVLIDCKLGEHIKKEGWYDWGRTEARKTAYYAEYNSHKDDEVARPDNIEREKWTFQLTKDEAEKYTRSRVLGNWDMEQTIQ